MVAFVNGCLWVVAVLCLIVAVGAFSAGLYDLMALEIGIAAALVILSKI